MAADLRRSKPAASRRTLDRAPGHPDIGMKPALGGILAALDLPETGPLVDGDCPAVERSHGGKVPPSPFGGIQQFRQVVSVGISVVKGVLARVPHAATTCASAAVIALIMNSGAVTPPSLG